MRRVLTDHRKVGSKLITPFNYLLNNQHDISWTREIIPELVATALIQFEHGEKHGVKLVTALARAARIATKGRETAAFDRLSDFFALTETDRANIQRSLEDGGTLDLIRRALSPLTSLYPDCALAFLRNTSGSKEEHLRVMKNTVVRLLDRLSREATMVQATAIWLMFDAEKLKVAADLALAKFPEIERYPDTELSQQIASGVRAMITGIHGSSRSAWPNDFWTRGWEIDDCRVQDDR